MHQVSDLYRAIAAGPYDVQHALVIGGVWYHTDKLVSVQISAAVMRDDEAPSVGNCCSRTIAIDMLAPATTIAINEQIVVKARITNGASTSEWINKGIFYVDTRQTNLVRSGEKTTITITGYDIMMRAEAPYPGSANTFPKTDAALLQEIITAMGGVACDTTLGNGYTVTAACIGANCREALGYLGAAYGGNWIINDEGHLQLLVLGQSSGDAIAVGPETLSSGDILQNIGMVYLHDMAGTTYQWGGNPNGRILHVDCPWATQQMAINVWNAVGWYAYQPFSATQTAVDPAIELGDVINPGIGRCIVYNMDVNLFAAEIANIGAPAELEINHDYERPYTSGPGGGGGGYAARQREQLKNPEWINEHTNIIVSADGKSSALDLWVRGQPGSAQSFAQLMADLITLNGKVVIDGGDLRLRDGSLIINGGDLTIRGAGTITASSIDLNSSSQCIYITDWGYFSPKTITLASGQEIILAR